MTEILSEVDGFVLGDVESILISIEELSDEFIGNIRDIFSIRILCELDALRFYLVPVEDVDTLAEESDELEEFREVGRIAVAGHFKDVVGEDFITLGVFSV